MKTIFLSIHGWHNPLLDTQWPISRAVQSRPRIAKSLTARTPRKFKSNFGIIPSCEYEASSRIPKAKTFMHETMDSAEIQEAKSSC